MPAPGVMKVRIGTDTQTNTPVKQVAFRFNGMSGPGPASSDQMLRAVSYTHLTLPTILRV